jgi:hypothetical protein
MTVATAAPLTPYPREKIRIGTSTILIIFPATAKTNKHISLMQEQQIMPCLIPCKL